MGKILGLVAVGAGAYHGFCDAKGIPFSKQGIEQMLTYGPAVVQGVVSAIPGGLAGMVFGGAGGASLGRTGTGMLVEGAGGAAAGSIGGAALTGGFGAAIGAIETLVGYGAGYIVGYVLK